MKILIEETEDEYTLRADKRTHFYKNTDEVIAKTKELLEDELTGELDIDRIITTHSKSTREKIRVVEDIIHGLIDKSPDNMAAIADIREGADEKGTDKHTLDKIINELRNKGVIYSPKKGKYTFTED